MILFLINTESYSFTVHVISYEQLLKAPLSDYAIWDTLNLYSRESGRVVINTPQEMFIDQRDGRYKWIPAARDRAGLILWDDGGQEAKHQGTTTYYRTTWLDQDQKEVAPAAVYCATQDQDNTIWVGTNEGIFTIPASVDFRTSNTCERIKIARNDGTNLADYLLGTEQVNTIVVDGANRKWIGTEGSGLYLMSEDGTETIEHFTIDNSPILSNQVLSIAIDPISGLVYIGTGAGLMSYQSDATEPQDNFSSAYAYPNPVRPEYEGVISIAGLMEETTVKITDSAGNVVFETISNGGLATWNGRNGAGKRVANGVYTAFCNSGSKHEVVKILIMY